MTRRKDGLWQETLTINGKRKYFYGNTKNEVLKKIKDYEIKADAGALFKDVLDDWWEEHSKTLAPNSHSNYLPAKKRAAEWLGDHNIKDIQPTDISRLLKTFAKSHSSKTIKTQLLIFNLVFKYAVETGDILYNPARDLTPPGGTGSVKRTSPSSNDIEKAIRSTECTFGMFAYWAMYTGMRKGELLALDWSDVDIDKRTIKINKSAYFVSNQTFLKTPKTETSATTIPILDALYKKIEPKKNGLIFPNENGELMTKAQYNTNWKKYSREAGITATVHQFRHAYATMLFEANVPPEEMQILLRHAQLSTTMDIYRDIRESKKKEIFNKSFNIDYVESKANV